MATLNVILFIMQIFTNDLFYKQRFVIKKGNHVKTNYSLHDLMSLLLSSAIL